MVEKTLSAADLPRLVVHLPDGKEVHHSIAGTEITIGRDPSNRISISDNFVSKFHAKLLVAGSSLTLVDLGSANKTYVNGRAVVGQTPVQFGDEIQFAGVRCRLHGPDAVPASPPVVPAPPAVPRPQPKAAPKPGPPVRPKPQAPAVAPGRSAPPRIEADPMQRLLRIGGLLILVSLALGVLLRVLLVPSGPSTEESESGSGPSTTSAPAPVAAEVPPPPPPQPVVAAGTSAQDTFDQALSYLDTGRLKEAQTAFRKVLELEPDNSRAKTRLSLLDEEISQKAERHFGNARQAFQFLRYEEAIAEWEMFLTLADTTDVRYAEAQQGIEQAKAKLR
jgi:hypothetical protein